MLEKIPSGKAQPSLLATEAHFTNSKKLNRFLLIFQNVVNYKTTKLFGIYTLRRAGGIEPESFINLKFQASFYN